MALCRCFHAIKLAEIAQSYAPVAQKLNLLQLDRFSIIPNRTMRRGWARFNIVMKRRLKAAGPAPLRKRSEWIDWNYQVELFAFPKRLQEEISENTLGIAFTNQSYIEEEERKRRQLGIPVQDVPLNLIPNDGLIQTGIGIMSPYIKKFVRQFYDKLPEIGVNAVHDYLMSDNVLAHVSSNIGTTELILTAEFPVVNSTLAATFKAVVGAIATDVTQERAELFVQDFLCTQLIGKDIFDIWQIEDPLSVLNSLLENNGCASSESRLLFESGRNTLEAIFWVALYTDKVFLGKAPGETLSVAEEMAAQDALRRFFKLRMNEFPLPFGKKGRKLCLDVLENSNISNYKVEKLLKNAM